MKKEVEYLIRKFSIKDIENSIVKIFLESLKLKTKNELIKDILKKNHENIKCEIAEYLKNKNICLDIKKIEKIFELLIETKDRKLNGEFYTPDFIVDYITKETISDNEKICDLSCGSGAFLIGAIKRIHKITKKPIINIIEKNIFGADISKKSIYHSKILLSLFAIINKEDKKKIKFNLINTDSLSYDWNKKFPKGFDVVLGNPPYVRAQNMPEESRKFINKKYFTASKGNTDLFIPFFELGISLLNKNGKMGYISPNSYLNSRASKNLRELFKEKKCIRKILDFNHLPIFKGVTTYTCITLIDKKENNSLDYLIIHDEKLINNLQELKFKKIKLSSLNSNKWTLLGNKNRENIDKIENSGGKLGNLAKITNGIATLKDELYLLNNSQNGKYYKKKIDNKEYLIEKKITRKIIKASILKDKDDIKNSNLRIIFPYELKGKTYKPINEKKLKKEFPKTHKYFLSIKDKLSRRDRGKREYGEWYAYGRVQGYNIFGPKIITPSMSPGPRFAICEEDKTLYYAGMGIFYDGNLNFLIKILNSKVFWYYIYKTSKEYKSDFFSLSKNFIENFTIPIFNKEEEKFIINKNQNEVDKFLIKKYNINI